MKTIISILLVAALTSPGQAADKEYRPLFDGKTLKGWTPTPGGKWEVKEGVIVGTSDKSERRHGILLSDRKYSDFIVQAQFRVLSGDSGFYFRAERVKNGVGVHGFQVEVDSSQETGGLYETGGRGWVHQPAAEVIAQRGYKPGEWTDLELSTLGEEIVVKINGVVTSELKNDQGRREGHFGLQLHGGQDMHVEFRTLRISELQPEITLNENADQSEAVLSDESQAKIINKKIEAYHEAQYQNASKVLRVIYFHANDQTPCHNYQPRWDGIIKDIKKFFDTEMARNGYPHQKLHIEIDKDKQAVLHVVQGKLKQTEYGYKSGRQIREEVKESLQSKSIDIETETILIICGLSKTDGDQVNIDSPFYGIGANQTRGTCFAMDSDWLEIPGLLSTDKRVQVREDHHPGEHYKLMSLSQFNVTYIGGTIHELGHGLSLPHNKATTVARQKHGTALMGAGNYTYRNELIRKNQKGSFLTHAHAVRLATHPLFTGSQRDLHAKANAELHDMSFSNQEGRILIQGRVKSDIPNAAVIAYHDPDGGGDYNARNWTTILDDNGQFQLVIDGPVTGKNQIRIVICHLNGATTQYRMNYVSDDQGVPLLEMLPESYSR